MSTKIEWTDETWNPTSGCTKVSSGCKNCYAERTWPRLSAPGQPYAGRKFTDLKCHPERLTQPLIWKKPRRVFVDSMSDLFHPHVSNDFILRVFAVMIKCPQHTFQILTKRPERMAYLINNVIWALDIAMDREEIPPNIWLGVSIEDQPTADERVLQLLDVSAAVRFLSIEPLLGPVDFYQASANWWVKDYAPWRNAPILTGIDWVIVGGESGPKARPMHPDWVRTLRDQCKESNTPFFFKQWGEWLHVPTVEDSRNLTHSRMKHFPNLGATFYRAGKKSLGRMLDGKHHEAYPV